MLGFLFAASSVQPLNSPTSKAILTITTNSFPFKVSPPTFTIYIYILYIAGSRMDDKNSIYLFRIIFVVY